MRTLNITFTTKEYQKLRKAKRKKEKRENTRYTWHKYFLLVGSNGVSIDYKLKKRSKDGNK